MDKSWRSVKHKACGLMLFNCFKYKKNEHQIVLVPFIKIYPDSRKALSLKL